jgi:hypothetical protein
MTLNAFFFFYGPPRGPVFNPFKITSNPMLLSIILEINLYLFFLVHICPKFIRKIFSRNRVIKSIPARTLPRARTTRSWGWTTCCRRSRTTRVSVPPEIN